MRMVTRRRAISSVLLGECLRTLIHLSDLEKLGMWEPLQGLLATPSDDIKLQALWVIGTALQNNPAAQKAVRFILPSALFPRARRGLEAACHDTILTRLFPFDPSFVGTNSCSTSPSTPSPPSSPSSPPRPNRPNNSAPKRYTRSRAS